MVFSSKFLFLFLFHEKQSFAINIVYIMQLLLVLIIMHCLCCFHVTGCYRYAFSYQKRTWDL